MDKILFFQEVTKRLCGTLHLDTALERCFVFLREHIPLDELRLNVLAPELHAVNTIAIADHRGGKQMLDSPQVVPLSAEALSDLSGDNLAEVRFLGTMVDDRVTAEVTEQLQGLPESSLLILRLRLDEQRQGAVVFRAEGKERYTEEHASMVAQLNEPFALALDNARTHHELNLTKEMLADDNRFLHRELRRRSGEEIVGADFGLAGVMELVTHVAPLGSPVLLLGETGVGKEVIANAIHLASDRRAGPLIKVNCGAMPETLVDSELFGHEKGAFTGAVVQKRGRFERANGGSLFLDEIGELPPDAQVRLLRVLQTKEFERVGGTAPIRSDVRVIAATHRNLENLILDGLFREDLWYRINVFPVVIPPLRQRKSDIPALVHHFMKKKAREIGMYPVPSLSEGALDRLAAYDWPGNVRELENVVERALILSHGSPLTFDEIGQRLRQPPTQKEPVDTQPKRLNQAIADHVRDALAFTGGKVSGPGGAAELLGVNPSTLRNKMKKLGIKPRRTNSRSR
jgi:transcriptional regulator with GAF, ATPase, and Fis domain